MKKNYSLKAAIICIMLIIGFITQGWAQNEEIIYQTGFEASEGFPVCTTYNNTTVLLTGEDGQQWGTYYGTPSTSNPIIGAQSMQMRWYSSSAPNAFGYTYTNFDLANVTKVNFYAASTNSVNVMVSYSTDGGTTYVGDSTIILTGSSTLYTYHVSTNGSYGSVRVKFTVSLPTPVPTSNSRLYIDNVTIYGMSGGIATPVFTPSAGLLTTPTNISISCASPNSDIYYTTDGTAPDSNSTLYTVPFNISATTTVKAIAYVGDTASGVATAIYIFPVEVPNIAAFRAANTTTSATVYKITGDVVFVFRSANNIYIQDNSGAILIYDSYTPVITTTYNEGDVISGGICGSYTLYNGLVEMIPVRNTAPSTSNVGPITPTEVSIDDINNNYLAYESKLVKITNVIFAGGTYTTAGASNINFYQDGDSITCRNVFKTLDTTIAAGYNANVVGFPLRYNTTNQIAPRSNADITPYTPVQNPSITINFPTEGAIFLTTDHFNASISIQDFVLGTDGLLKLESPILSALGVPSPYYINSDLMLNYLSTIPITLPVGNYSITASLVGLDSTDLTPSVSVVRNFSFIAPTVAAPVFNPIAGTYYEPQQVAITSTTDSTSIYYTTDGTNPTGASTLYAGPITVNNNMTIKAIAIRAGWNDSPISEAAYIIVYDPVLVVDPTTLNFTDIDSIQQFTVSGYYLTAPINISCDNVNFSFTPTTLPDTSSSAIVTVTFTGNTATSGIITVTSDTVSVPVNVFATIVPPILTVAPTTLSFTDLDSVRTFTVSGSYLTAPISISCDNNNFEVTPTTLSQTAQSEIVTVTFTGDSAATGIITVTSDTVTETILLTATIAPEPGLDTIIYRTGFESSEGFAASIVYNNTTVAFTGPNGGKWGTYYGTPSTTAPILGGQSMQMRWYTSAANNLGYTYTDFDLRNVTKLYFQAKNTNNLKLTLSYSIDGGSTFMGDSVYVIDTTKATYLFNVSQTGQYDYVRIKFKITLPSTNPTATSRMYLDSLVVYGIPGVVPSTVTTPTVSPNPGYYYDPQLVSISCTTDGAEIRYTTDGTEPTSTSTLYSSPINISTTTTLKAKAWKTGLNSSYVATALYQFPTEVANIAAFKAANTQTNPTIYKISGDVTFVFRAGRYVHIQDNSGALLIYDNSTPVITSAYVEGDVISGGIYGTYSLYNGLVELVPTRNPAVSTNNTGLITPVEVTVSDLTDNYANYESKLVKINNVIFEEGIFSTSAATSILFSQNGNDMDCRNTFKTLDMTIPDGYNADVVGFPSIFNGSVQLAPRGNNDIIEIPLVQLPTPTFSPEGGTYQIETSMNIAINCDTAGSSIYYTLDGNAPDSNSTLYTDSITLSIGTTIVKAIAYKTGMLPSEIATATYNLTTGINENNNLTIILYPNPTSSIVNIELPSLNNAQIELLSMDGQLILSSTVTENVITLNLSQYSDGIYFIRILTGDGSITRKIVKM